MDEEKIRELIIIGCGPAGLSAGIYARRYALDTLIICKDFGLGGEAPYVENYPGFKGIRGEELMNIFREQAESLGVEIIFEEITGLKKIGKIFEVFLEDEVIRARSIIIATGAKHRRLNIPGELEFLGKGVSYCAVCDAPVFKDKRVAVIGGGDTACSSAYHLSFFSRKVYLILRSNRFRAEPYNITLLKRRENIEILYNKRILSIFGDNFVRGIDLNDRKLNLDGVFIEIGVEPNIELIKNLGCKTDDEGYIIVDDFMRTTVAGVFAAGDATNSFNKFQQIITASAGGVLAAKSAYEYLRL